VAGVTRHVHGLIPAASSTEPLRVGMVAYFFYASPKAGSKRMNLRIAAKVGENAVHDE
jgi:hypothetical protein